MDKNNRKKKGFLSGLWPDEYAESVFRMDFSARYESGVRLLIFDIDNTLVEDNVPADERAVLFLDSLKHMGFKLMILSNNKEKRVRSFAEAVGVDYICKAGKPRRDGYISAMKKAGIDSSRTLFIGDQIFTDIWGANRAGVCNVMVDRLSDREEIQILLKRIPERLVLFLDERWRSRHKGVR